MIDDGKPIEVNCHFCNKNYSFSVEELKEMLEKARQDKIGQGSWQEKQNESKQ